MMYRFAGARAPRLNRRLLLAGGLVAAALLAVGAQPERAEALCTTPPEYGTWVNADRNTRGIARIRITNCHPITTCSGDTCSTTHDVGWRMRVWGKCTPTNCDWGWSAPRLKTASGKVYGFYHQGFAKRYVWAKMSAHRRGQLWVGWRTDFVDPARADYERHEYFVRG